MSFNTISTIEAALADILKLQGGSSALTGSYTSTIAQNALDAATQEIITRLAQRGFTSAQIQSWDRGAEFERDIALWWALTKGAALQNVDATMINKLDRRGELEFVVVTAGGTVIIPTNIIGFGALDVTQSEFKRTVDSNGCVTRIPW